MYTIWPLFPSPPSHLLLEACFLQHFNQGTSHLCLFIPNSTKNYFTVILVLLIRSLKIFAFHTTAQLLCGMQNFLVITIKFWMRTKRYFHRIRIIMGKILSEISHMIMYWSFVIWFNIWIYLVTCEKLPLKIDWEFGESLFVAICWHRTTHCPGGHNTTNSCCNWFEDQVPTHKFQLWSPGDPFTDKD